MPRKFFSSDYTDYFIERTTSKNVCGTKLRDTYRLKYASYIFWFKHYTYFEEGFYWEYPVTADTKEKIIEEYLKYVTCEEVGIEEVDICKR